MYIKRNHISEFLSQLGNSGHDNTPYLDTVGVGQSCSHSHYFILRRLLHIRLVILCIRSLDCPCHRHHHYHLGRLLDLPRRLQLPGRLIRFPLNCDWCFMLTRRMTDAYLIYASFALAGRSLIHKLSAHLNFALHRKFLTLLISTENLMHTIFPFYGVFKLWTGTLIGFRFRPRYTPTLSFDGQGYIASLLAVIPFVLFFWGPKIRARSCFATLAQTIKQ